MRDQAGFSTVTILFRPHRDLESPACEPGRQRNVKRGDPWPPFVRPGRRHYEFPLGSSEATSSCRSAKPASSVATRPPRRQDSSASQASLTCPCPCKCRCGTSRKLTASSHHSCFGCADTAPRARPPPSVRQCWMAHPHPSPFADERHADPPPPEPKDAPPDLPGCESFPMTLDELERDDERLEFWDRRTETAWRVREASSWHEQPGQRLAMLAARMASVRGAQIECFGSTSLARLDAAGRPRQILQADNAVYLRVPAGPGEHGVSRLDGGRGLSRVDGGAAVGGILAGAGARGARARGARRHDARGRPPHPLPAGEGRGKERGEGIRGRRGRGVAGSGHRRPGGRGGRSGPAVRVLCRHCDGRCIEVLRRRGFPAAHSPDGGIGARPRDLRAIDPLAKTLSAALRRRTSYTVQ